MAKRVLDYLYEWAEEQGSWAKLLIANIINKGSVSEKEREEIYNLFLLQLGAIQNTELRENKTIIPNNSHTKHTQVILESLSDIQGVNRLAKNQVMKFSKNLTVIYGNNGSGKTGYSRILKSLGFSYDKHTNILPNVFESEQTEKVALIKFNTDNNRFEFRWNDKQISEELSGIGVFNSDSVKLSLDSKRNFIVTPKGFHLFNLVSIEIEKLQKVLTEEITEKRKQPELFDELTEGTEVYKFINGITHSSFDKDEFNSIFNFTEEDNDQIQSLENEKEKLNKLLILNEIDSFNKKIKELNTLKVRINNTEKIINKTLWEKHLSNLDNLNILEGKKEKGIEEIVKEKGVAFFQTEQFKNFITSAEKYIKMVGNQNYPNETDTCIYCLQPLDKNARELIESYRTLLNDTTESDIEILKKEINSNAKSMKGINTDLELMYEPFGVNDDGTPMLPQEILCLFNQLQIHKELLESLPDDTTSCYEFNIKFEKSLEVINKRVEDLETDLKSKQELLKIIDQKENEIQNLINRLKDSKKISENKQIIYEYVENLNYAYILESSKKKFNTRSLSIKSSNARKDLIEKRFEDLFKEELRKLRCPENITISFGTQKSVPKIEQNINKQYSLEDIFSEGEQKSVALANFITELRISEQFDPVIFDDPVNSLDHQRINIVARRLIHLSLERQTIIFTHNVLLFYAIEQIISDSKIKLEYQYYTVDKDLNNTGYLYENVPPHKETYKTYVSKVNLILSSSKEERVQRESKLAQEGYNYLRSAIELLVEDEIFKKVVKRYKRNITFGQFEKINGTTLDSIKQELTDVFHQCCCYIEAHSNPEELADLPTLEQLKLDFERIKEIRELFK